MQEGVHGSDRKLYGLLVSGRCGGWRERDSRPLNMAFGVTLERVI